MSVSEPLTTTFGLTLARWRRERSLTQESLAELAAVHRTYVSQVERGQKSPTLTVLFRFAAALGVPASTLIYEVERADA